MPDLPPTGWFWLFVDTTRQDGLFPHALIYADVPSSQLRSTPGAKLEWTAGAPVFEPSFALASIPALDDDRLLELPEGTSIGGSGPRWCGSGAMEAALHALGLAAIEPYRHMSDARLNEEIALHREARPEWAHAHARFLESVVRPKLTIFRQRRAEIEERARRFRTLLVIASERDIGWCWGDAGLLEVLIDGEDLRARRFEHTYLRLCSS